jgi:hypothetical protein
LARIGVAGGGFGSEAQREDFAGAAEPVGPAAPGVGDDLFQGVFVLEPLPKQIPEGNERGPEPLIMGAFRGWQAA